MNISLILKNSRHCRENYKIVFKFKDSTHLYQKGEGNDPTKWTSISYIDLEKEVLGSNERKELFIKGVLYGGDKLEQELRLKGIDIKDKINSDIHLNSNPLYDIIGGRRFREYLGVYYQEEIQGASDTPEVNKTKKRVITYEEI